MTRSRSKISLNKKTVDARGLFCPGPLQVLKGIIRHLESGSVVELLADDPDTRQEIKDWCETSGNNLLAVENIDGILTFLVKKS
jgi:tRNA 2-thiouridine synthesizing protein A